VTVTIDFDNAGKGLAVKKCYVRFEPNVKDKWQPALVIASIVSTITVQAANSAVLASSNITNARYACAGQLYAHKECAGCHIQ
jgi:hypothetical protein